MLTLSLVSVVTVRLEFYPPCCLLPSGMTWKSGDAKLDLCLVSAHYSLEALVFLLGLFLLLSSAKYLLRKYI